MAAHPSYPGCCGFSDKGDEPPGNLRYSTDVATAVFEATVLGAKYYGGGGAVFPFPPSAGCVIASAASGAVAADVGSKACWGVTGLPITIDDRKDTLMAACERTNFNFHVNGTVQAAGNNYLLNARAFA